METKKSANLTVFKALSKENTTNILMEIFENSAMSPSQLAVKLGLNPTQVHRALDELIEADLIQRQIGTQTPLKSWVFYRPTPAGKEAVDLLLSEKFK